MIMYVMDTGQQNLLYRSDSEGFSNVVTKNERSLIEFKMVH